MRIYVLDPFKAEWTNIINNTRRSRSRAQHVQDGEADIEREKNWRLVHLRCSKGKARRARPRLGCVFVQRRRKRRMARTEGPSRCLGCGSFVEEREVSGEPIFGGVWSKTPNSSPRRLAIGCFQGNQYVTLSSTVLFRAVAFQQTVLPPSHALILCAIARKLF